MTAFNFPAGANEGQEYAAPNGTTYVFDGEKWNVKSASLSAVATSGSYSDLTDTPEEYKFCLLYTSPSPRDGLLSRMPSSA